MPYEIKKTNGELILDEGFIENNIDRKTLPVAIVGKLTADYGVYQSENFVHLLENFAHTDKPTNPLKGMIWYNTTNQSLYVCIDDEKMVWQKIATVLLEKSVVAESGDFYYDEYKHQLYVYDEQLKFWNKIGPTSVDYILEDVRQISTKKTNPNDFIKINIPNDCVCNVELRIVAKEELMESEKSLRRPECATWNIKCCIASYSSQEDGFDTQKTEIIGSPSIERIASTNNADDWYCKAYSNSSNNLSIDISGFGASSSNESENKVNWNIYYHIIKVE